MPAQSLAAFVGRNRLLKLLLAALERAHNLLELGESLFERHLGDLFCRYRLGLPFRRLLCLRHNLCPPMLSSFARSFWYSLSPCPPSLLATCRLIFRPSVRRRKR